MPLLEVGLDLEALPLEALPLVVRRGSACFRAGRRKTWHLVKVVAPLVEAVVAASLACASLLSPLASAPRASAQQVFVACLLAVLESLVLPVASSLLPFPAAAGTYTALGFACGLDRCGFPSGTEGRSTKPLRSGYVSCEGL